MKLKRNAYVTFGFLALLLLQVHRASGTACVGNPAYVGNPASSHVLKTTCGVVLPGNNITWTVKYRAGEGCFYTPGFWQILYLYGCVLKTQTTCYASLGLTSQPNGFKLRGPPAVM